MSFAKRGVSEVADCEVLVVDGSAHYVGALHEQLSLVKVPYVSVASTASDAMQMLRARRYDLVFCDYEIDGPRGALHLLEACREVGTVEQSTTAFVVMTSNATARMVADCRDVDVDALLLRPTTASLLEQRIQWLLKRRATFFEVRRRLASGDAQGALDELSRVIARGGPWAGRARLMKGGALLQAQRLDEAIAAYEAVLEEEPGSGWALLGLARAHGADGDHDRACRIARSLLSNHQAEPYIEAFDVLAHSLDEQGDGDSAIKVLQEAAALVPAPRRLRNLGETAYRYRQLAAAHRGFDRLVRTTRGTPVSSDMDTLRLAQVEVDLQDTANALRATDGVLKGTTPYSDIAGAACALRAQAFARMRKPREASDAIEQARESNIEPAADLPTLAMAKAELMTGSEEAGLSLLNKAFSSRSDARVRRSVDNILVDTERQHHAQRVFTVPVSEALPEENVRPTWSAWRSSAA